MAVRLGEALIFLKGEDRELKSALADAKKSTDQWAKDVGKGLVTSAKGPATSLRAITAEWQKSGQASKGSVQTTLQSLRTMQGAFSDRKNVDFLASITKQWEEGGNVSAAQLKRAIKAVESLDAEGRKAGNKVGKETGAGLKDSLTRSVSGLAGIVTGAIRGLGQIGLAGLGVQTLANTFRGIGEQLGFGLNVEMENIEAQLLAFTKSAPAAKAILAEIRAEADKTPFAFQEMAKATAGLMPAARQSGEELMDLVRIAEILAASNPAQGLEGAAFSLREALSGDYVSIVERFNLPRQYLNQLKEEGVPAIEAVRRAMESIGYDTDLVGNLAATASGKWSTLMDTMDGVRRRFSEQAFGVGKDWLDGIQQALNDNIETINEWADTLGRGLARVMEELPRMVSDWRRAWEEMGDEARRRIIAVGALLVVGGPLLQAFSVAMQGVGLLAASFGVLPVAMKRAVAGAVIALIPLREQMAGFVETMAGMDEYVRGFGYQSPLRGLSDWLRKDLGDLAGDAVGIVIDPLFGEIERRLAGLGAQYAQWTRNYPKTWQEEVGDEIAMLKTGGSAVENWANQAQSSFSKVTKAAQEVRTAFEEMLRPIDARIAEIDLKRAQEQLERLLSRRAPTSARGREAYERAVLEQQRNVLGLQNQIYQASDQYAAQTGQGAPRIVLPTGNTVSVGSLTIDLSGAGVATEGEAQSLGAKAAEAFNRRLAELVGSAGQPSGMAAAALPGAG